MTDRILATKPPSWLFTKDDRSVWVVRTADLALVVSGPCRSRVRYEFASDDQMQRFQIGLAEQLAWAGWFLQASNRDRRAGVERRSPTRRHWAAERRVSSRAAVDVLTIGIRRGTCDSLPPQAPPVGDHPTAYRDADAPRRLDGWTTGVHSPGGRQPSAR